MVFKRLKINRYRFPEHFTFLVNPKLSRYNIWTLKGNVPGTVNQSLRKRLVNHLNVHIYIIYSVFCHTRLPKIKILSANITSDYTNGKHLSMRRCCVQSQFTFSSYVDIIVFACCRGYRETKTLASGRPGEFFTDTSTKFPVLKQKNQISDIVIIELINWLNSVYRCLCFKNKSHVWKEKIYSKSVRSFPKFLINWFKKMYPARCRIFQQSWSDPDPATWPIFTRKKYYRILKPTRG